MKESEIRPPELFNKYLSLAQEDCRNLLGKVSGFVDLECPACAETRKSLAFEKLGFKYVTCEACETLYVSPRPSPDLLEEFYSKGMSVAFWSTHFYKESYEARKEKIFRPRAALVRDLMERYSADTSSIVDIGAGYGTFLEEIQKLKLFDALWAVEPNPDLAAICREKGFRVVESRIEDVPEGSPRATCVSAFEILEHIFRPVEFLRSVRHMLRPSGLLLLTTLTVTGFDIQVLWESSKSVYPPHHLNLMSTTGIERLLARAGLRVLEMSTPGRLDVDIVANTLRENPNVSAPRFVLQLLKSSDQTRQSFQEFLKSNRLSSHVQIVAQRDTDES